MFVPVQVVDGCKKNGFRGVMGTGASQVCDFRNGSLRDALGRARCGMF